MADKKQTSKALQPTSFTEINRIHRHALAKAKKGSLILTSSSAGEGVTTLAHTMAVRNADNGDVALLRARIRSVASTRPSRLMSCGLSIDAGFDDPRGLSRMAMISAAFARALAASLPISPGALPK